MNKRTKPEQIAAAVKLAEQAGIGFGGNLIFGDPAETEETIYESMNFLFRHLTDCVVPMMSVQPYPGSLLFDRMTINKLDYYEHINETIFNMTAIPQERFTELVRMTQSLDNLQWWVKKVETTRYEKETEPDILSLTVNRSFFKVWAECPHCGAEVFYREMAAQAPFEFFTCCTQCHKRIKVSVKEAK